MRKRRTSLSDLASDIYHFLVVFDGEFTTHVHEVKISTLVFEGRVVKPNANFFAEEAVQGSKKAAQEGPATATLEAYNDTNGQILNAARGSNVPGNVGK